MNELKHKQMIIKFEGGGGRIGENLSMALVGDCMMLEKDMVACIALPKI